MINESVKVLGDNKHPTFDEIKKLTYAHAVYVRNNDSLFETLRLYPSVPANVKRSNRASLLPDGTEMPAYSFIGFSSYAMGRLESVWGPDAASFNPSRWISDDGSLIRESPFKFLSFHAGPRTCLGQNLATVEAVSVLSIIYLSFDFVLVSPDTVTYQDSLTLPIKGGLFAKVIHRSK